MMEPIVKALLVWISLNSSYEAVDTVLPAVVEMTPVELTREYYADAPNLVPQDGIDDRVLALYAAEDGDHGTIYILAAAQMDGADMFDDPHDNVLWREMLLHELVHHVQWSTGIADGWACQREGEFEAYLLGGRYLRQRKVDDPLPNRNFLGRIYSTC